MHKMKRCELVPALLKYLDIPDNTPCMQILYETLACIKFKDLISGEEGVLSVPKDFCGNAVAFPM